MIAKGSKGLIVEAYSIDEMVERFPGTTRGSWAQLRFRGSGPDFFKIGRKVFYSREAVETWIKTHSRSQTGDAA